MKKYVSADKLGLVFEKHTQKAIAFVDESPRGERQIIWVPKSQMKVAYNNSDDFIFCITSWFYMQNMNTRLFNSGMIKHHIESDFLEYYEQFESLDKVQLD